jgi:predicted nicotinamide N-methyase
MDMDLPFTQDVAYRFDSLFQWLNRKYQLEQAGETIDGEVYRFFKIKNIDEVLEQVLEESPCPDDHAPYWSEFWPSAPALAQFISREVNLEGKNTIELGCGMGLAGIVAHRRGAKVVLSDVEEDALRLAELNWIVNFMDLPAVARLDWASASLWGCNPALNQKFEIILASDVAYEKRLFWPLIDTFQQLLVPGGEIFLSEPNRPIAAEFFKMLNDNGFEYRKFAEMVEYNRKKIAVSVYRIYQ